MGEGLGEPQEVLESVNPLWVLTVVQSYFLTWFLDPLRVFERGAHT